MSKRPDHVPLSPVDAAWLRMDSPANAMVITTVLRFARPLSEDAIDATLARMLGYRRFRQRVVHDRRTLTGAAWEDDPDFDLARHVRRVRLPEPGDERALMQLVSARMSTPLDRTKPLWQVDLVDGVGEGSALVMRVHHAVGDGVALVRLLLDISGAPKEHEPVEVGIAKRPRPTRARDYLLRGWSNLETTARLLLLPPDAKTKLRGPLDVRKVVAISRAYSVDTVKALARAHGGHVNDLLAAAIAGALRNYLPFPRPVRAMIPVFLRGRGDEGNHFGLVYLPLPVDERDRGTRIRAVKAQMDVIKSAPDASVAFAVLGAMGLASTSLERVGIGLFTMKATLLMTNVPGPVGRVQVAGEDVTSMVVWAPTSGSLGLGFSLLTYAGELRLGVAADANLVRDPDALVEAFERELDDMLREARIEASRS